MWDYIYFYLYLVRIDTSDHNAIESYVYHQVSNSILILLLYTYIPLQIKNGKTDFFPLHCAKSIKATPDKILDQQNELKQLVAENTKHLCEHEVKLKQNFSQF